jgi:hypothetical protein
MLLGDLDDVGFGKHQRILYVGLTLTILPCLLHVSFLNPTEVAIFTGQQVPDMRRLHAWSIAIPLVDGIENILRE